MSVASRIQEIETHIGDIYDTLEVGGTDLTDLNKNIVNINSSLKDRYKYFLNNGVEVIWNNWEKVIGEGTEFTLENTIQAPTKINLKGNTYQKSTTGKNLFDKDSITVSNHYIDVNGGTTSAPDWLCTYDYVKIEPNTDYIVSFENMGARFIWAEYDENKTCIGNRHENTTGAIQTTTAKYIRFCTNNPNATILQVEEGTTATTPEEYTGGNPAPNPDYPQDIHVVSGDNSIEVCGKNLFDLDWVVYRTTNGITATKGEDCIVLNGTATATAYINFAFPSDITSIIDTTAHTWFFKTTQNISKIQIRRDTVGVVNILNPTTLTKNTFGNILTGGYVEISSGTTLNNCKVYIDARKGILTLDGYEFAPHQEQTYPINLGSLELCKIGDYQDYIIRSSGKNLFDKNNYNSYDGYISGTGTVNIVSAANNNIVYIDCLPNTQYTVSKILSQRFRIGYSIDAPNSNVVVYGTLNGDSQTSLTITTGSDAKYLVIYLRNGNLSNELSLETILNSLQIEEGNQATRYEPYGKGKWYLHKEIGKVVLDGSENWQTTDNRNTGDTFYAATAAIDLSRKADALDLICNNFKKLTDLWSNFNTEGTQIYNLGYNLRFRILKTALSEVTLDSFKTWLSNNNTIVYYVLATPTTTEITDTTLISQLEAIKYSYDEQTNISQVNNDMPFKLEVTALKNI